MSETPTNPNASRFTELTTEQVEAQRRSAYAYAFPPAPELLSAERLAEIQELALEWHVYYTKKAYTSWPPRLATTNRRELLAHIDAQAIALQAAEEQLNDIPMPSEFSQYQQAELQKAIEYVYDSGKTEWGTLIYDLRHAASQAIAAGAAQANQIRSLTMRADSADWAAQELTDENTALLLTIASRDQWADQLAEHYATREAEFKAVLQDLIDPRYDFYNDFSRNDWLVFKHTVIDHAAKLDITLD